MNLNPIRAVRSWARRRAAEMLQAEYEQEIAQRIRERARHDPHYVEKVRRDPTLLYELMGERPPTGGCR